MSRGLLQRANHRERDTDDDRAGFLHSSSSIAAWLGWTTIICDAESRTIAWLDRVNFDDARTGAHAHDQSGSAPLASSTRRKPIDLPAYTP